MRIKCPTACGSSRRDVPASRLANSTLDRRCVMANGGSKHHPEEKKPERKEPQTTARPGREVQVKKPAQK